MEAAEGKVMDFNKRPEMFSQTSPAMVTQIGAVFLIEVPLPLPIEGERHKVVIYGVCGDSFSVRLEKDEGGV